MIIVQVMEDAILLHSGILYAHAVEQHLLILMLVAWVYLLPLVLVMEVLVVVKLKVRLVLQKVMIVELGIFVEFLV
jgi:hypothetical protein